MKMISINLFTLRHAFLGAVRVVYPFLPNGGLRAAVVDDGSIVTIDDYRYVEVDGMNPLAVLRKKGPKFFIRRFGLPLLVWAHIPRLTIRIYRRIKRDRAGEAAGKNNLETVATHAPNRKSAIANRKFKPEEVK